MNFEQVNTFTDDRAADILREAVEKHALSTKDADFARSLYRGYRQYGSFTAKQRHWVVKLIIRAHGGEAKAKPEAIDIGGKALVAFFDTAAKGLKWPKVRLEFGNGQPLFISRAGERAREPFSLNITDGRPYGSNTWYGRISRDGTFTPGGACNAGVTTVLKELAENPEQTASAYGHITGRCCFCGRELTDERSVTVGYGPVCAGHYGLPWGEKPAPVSFGEPVTGTYEAGAFAEEQLDAAEAIQAEREAEEPEVREGYVELEPLQQHHAVEDMDLLAGIINPRKRKADDDGYIPLEV